MTATIPKNTHNKAVKGKASSKDLPIECSSITPLIEVAKTIIDSPINPTAAKWPAKPTTNQTAIRP